MACIPCPCVMCREDSASQAAHEIVSPAYDAAIGSVLGETPSSEADGVLSGYFWSGPVTYSFPVSATNYEAGYGEVRNGFSGVSEAQSQAVRWILEGSSGQAGGPVYRYGSFESVILLPISEVESPTGGGLDTADIRVAQSSSANPTAYAYYPEPGAGGHAGDVWFGTSFNYREPLVGSYAWTTHIHELGHAMGLKHGHEAAPYGALPVERDALEFSLMTYRSFVGGPADNYRVETYGGPQTLMMYDIAALQYLYGADFTTNASDTVYYWNTWTGEMSLNGIGQGAPAGGIGGEANRVLLTVWDGGGSDTYDLSNYVEGVSIDLRPGQWSITSQAQRADLDVLNPGQHYAAGNVYNALLHKGDTRSYIENAIGGSGSDLLVGNDIGNSLRGGDGADEFRGGLGDDWLEGDAGDDTMFGGRGNDTLQGGAGIDTAVFESVSSRYRVTSLADGWIEVVDLESGSADGLDRLLGIEVLQFANKTILPFEVIEADGATRLVRANERFLLHDSGGSGPSLKYYGDDFRAGQFGEWKPIGAEATAEGYLVAWKAGDADEYTFWNADGNGNYSSQLTGVVGGADPGLRSLETDFHQDLNGDGAVGSPALPFEVIEANGATRLVQANERFFLHEGAAAGPSLKYYGDDYRAGQFGDWTPIGAEATAEGYVVAWKAGDADEYTFWNADGNGNYSSQLTGVVGDPDPGLRSLETVFQQDLNRDGAIGSDTMAARQPENQMSSPRDDGRESTFNAGWNDVIVDAVTIADLARSRQDLMQQAADHPYHFI